MFPPTTIPARKGCEATCGRQGRGVLHLQLFCEWDDGRCWSLSGRTRAPVDEAQMRTSRENYGSGQHVRSPPRHVPPHDYPGTEDARRAGRRPSRGVSCTSAFFCEWDGEAITAGQLSGRGRAPPTRRRCTTSGEGSIPTTCSLLTNIPAPMDVRRRARAMTRPRSFAPPTFTASGTASDAGPLSGRSRARLTKRR